jgi:hypothetical protein
MLAVAVVCPSLVKQVVRPVAKSAVRALNAVAVIVVPPTTGWPDVLMLKTPEPLKLIGLHSHLK